MPRLQRRDGSAAETAAAERGLHRDREDAADAPDAGVLGSFASAGGAYLRVPRVIAVDDAVARRGAPVELDRRPSALREPRRRLTAVRCRDPRRAVQLVGNVDERSAGHATQDVVVRQCDLEDAAPEPSVLPADVLGARTLAILDRLEKAPMLILRDRKRCFRLGEHRRREY